MKLSMYMLAWYLRDYRPVIRISEDGLTVHGLRFLPEQPGELQHEYLYFGEARYYISDEQHQHRYIIVNKSNYLLFDNADYEELLNSILSAFDFFNDWERQLLELSSGKGTLQDILEVAAAVLENPCVVGDLGSGRLYAKIKPRVPVDDPYWMYAYEEGEIHPAAFNEPYYTLSGELIRDLSPEPVLVKNVYAGGAPVLMMYLFQGIEPVACLSILQADASVTEMNLQLAPAVGRYLTMSSDFSSDHAIIRSGERVFRDLLSSSVPLNENGKQLLNTIRRQGLTEEWRLLYLRHVIRTDQIQRRSVLRILRSDERFVLPIEYEKGILALLPETFCGSIEHILKEKIHMNRFTICLSFVSSDLYAVQDSLRQVWFTFMKASGKAGIFRCEDFSFDYLKETFRAQDLTLQLLHPSLKILRQYDLKNGTELRKSLTAYLFNECNVVKAARQLNVHRNTLKYRLSRIRELTGIHFEDGRELQYLRISDWLE